MKMGSTTQPKITTCLRNPKKTSKETQHKNMEKHPQDLKHPRLLDPNVCLSQVSPMQNFHASRWCLWTNAAAWTIAGSQCIVGAPCNFNFQLL